MENGKRIVRPRDGRKVAGVCAAFANFFGVVVGSIIGRYRIVGIPYLLVGNTRGGPLIACSRYGV